MKLLKKLLTGILTLAVIITSISAAPARVKAITDGDLDSAQVMDVGEKLKDSVTDDPKVWYKFTTSSTKEPWYRIGCIYKSNDYYGPQMYLYDEDGIELSRKGLSPGVNNVLDIKLDPKTTYYVYITFADNTDYTLYVEEIKDDITDNEEQAVPIRSGIKITGKFESNSDSDVYTFAAGSSKTVISASLKYKSRNASLMVYDEDGKQMLRESVYDAESKSFTIETVKGQKYIVIYKPYQASDIDYVGTYSLTVKSGSTDIKNLTMDLVYNKETKDIYLFNGKVRLTAGTDYTIKVGKISGGKVTVTVSGKGTYSGKLSKVCYVAGK